MGYNTGGVKSGKPSSQQLVADLNLSRPIMMCGSATSAGGGHAWVIDGYQIKNRPIYITYRVFDEYGTTIRYEEELDRYETVYFFCVNWGEGDIGTYYYNMYQEVDNYQFANQYIMNIRPK